MLEEFNDILTLKDVQTILKIGKNSALDFIHDGDIEAFMIKGRWRYITVTARVRCYVVASYFKILNLPITGSSFALPFRALIRPITARIPITSHTRLSTVLSASNINPRPPR